MGNVIPRSAGPDRIVEDFTETLVNARLRDGYVKEAAESRLAPLKTTLDEASDRLEQAEDTANQDWSELLVRDGESDLEIGAVLDEIWNALGRRAQSVEYTLIAGTGKGQWTDGDPLTQHNLMAALEQAIRQTTATLLQDKKDAWADRIKAKAEIQKTAAEKAAKSQSELAVQQLILRGLANVIQVSLVRLKRDYKNDGMTETQIHEIIPDYVRRPRRESKPTDDPPPAEG